MHAYACAQSHMQKLGTLRSAEGEGYEALSSHEIIGNHKDQAGSMR